MYKTSLFPLLSFKTKKLFRIVKFQNSKSYLFIIIDSNDSRMICDFCDGAFLKHSEGFNINSWDASGNCYHLTSSPHMSMAEHARPSHQGKNLEGQCSCPRQATGPVLYLLFQCSGFNMGDWLVTAVGLTMRLFSITCPILSFLKIISKIKPLEGPINPSVCFYKFHFLCCSVREKF